MALEPNVIVRRFLAYGAVGFTGTVVHYALLLGLVALARLDAMFASTVGAIAGAIANYLLNRRFTFESERRHREALPRFCAVAVVGLGINAAVMWVGVQGLALHYLVAQCLATFAVLFVGYAANSRWAFGPTSRLRDVSRTADGSSAGRPAP